MLLSYIHSEGQPSYQNSEDALNVGDLYQVPVQILLTRLGMYMLCPTLRLYSIPASVICIVPNTSLAIIVLVYSSVSCVYTNVLSVV